MNTEKKEKIAYERTKWACRRGMLEIDLFLVPFFEHCYQDLTPEEKESFQQLLTESDPDLHAYLTTETKPKTQEVQEIVKKIRSYRRIYSKGTSL